MDWALPDDWGWKASFVATALLASIPNKLVVKTDAFGIALLRTCGSQILAAVPQVSLLVDFIGLEPEDRQWLLEYIAINYTEFSSLIGSGECVEELKDFSKADDGGEYASHYQPIGAIYLMKVSAIINCCCEGLLLQRSLDSAIRSMEAAGFTDESELIVVADSANRTTLSVLAGYGARLSRVLHTDFSDLGSARNAGAEAARGELLLFLDGDDLWGFNWVRAAWSEYLKSPQETIFHPQYCVFFGLRSEGYPFIRTGETRILIHVD